jgi:hypothetical protein
LGFVAGLFSIPVGNGAAFRADLRRRLHRRTFRVGLRSSARRSPAYSQWRSFWRKLIGGWRARLQLNHALKGPVP